MGQLVRLQPAVKAGQWIIDKSGLRPIWEAGWNFSVNADRLDDVEIRDGKMLYAELLHTVHRYPHDLDLEGFITAYKTALEYHGCDTDGEIFDQTATYARKVYQDHKKYEVEANERRAREAAEPYDPAANFQAWLERTKDERR